MSMSTVVKEAKEEEVIDRKKGNKDKKNESIGEGRALRLNGWYGIEREGR